MKRGKAVRHEGHAAVEFEMDGPRPWLTERIEVVLPTGALFCTQVKHVLLVDHQGERVLYDTHLNHDWMKSIGDGRYELEDDTSGYWPLTPQYIRDEVERRERRWH